MSSYYTPRWALFLNMTLASLEAGARPFNQSDYDTAWMAQIGLPWSNMTSPCCAGALRARLGSGGFRRIIYQARAHFDSAAAR